MSGTKYALRIFVSFDKCISNNAVYWAASKTGHGAYLSEMAGTSAEQGRPLDGYAMKHPWLGKTCAHYCRRSPSCGNLVRLRGDDEQRSRPPS